MFIMEVCVPTFDLSPEQLSILRRAQTGPIEWTAADVSVETSGSYLALTQAGFLIAEQTHVGDAGKSRFKYTWTGKAFE